MSALLDASCDTFAVPPRLEAREPSELRGVPRDRVRLLVSDRATGTITHARFDALPSVLLPGDLLIANDSATLPAALRVRRSSGSELVLHVADECARDVWIVEPRGLAHAGETFAMPGNATATLIAPLDAAHSRLWRAGVSTASPHAAYLRAYGSPIHYAYAAPNIPIDSYQTFFARPRASGSAEMPSAGRPFTARMLRHLRARAIDVRTVTLHTGVSSPEAHESPQPERFFVSQRTAQAVNAARRDGRRIVAVGTTVVRALESAARNGVVVASMGRTTHLVNVANPPRVVDGLITGFHEPRASHFTMLETFLPRASLMSAYAAALEGEYLWHEFGDVHLIV